MTYGKREKVIFSSKNPKLFWSYVNNRSKNDLGIRSVKVSDVEISDGQVMTNIFNDYFTSVFSAKRDISIPDNNHTLPSPALDSISVSAIEVIDVLKKLPPKIATDGDGLCYKVLKEGGVILASILSDLFSLSLRTSQVPSAWKIAIVKPIHKKGSRNDVGNYRPISITSSCCRVMERIVRYKINNFLLVNSLLSDSQHGFMRGRSTDTILLSFYDFITSEMDSNKIVDAIFFDFAKAFDKIPHDLLISRLFEHRICGSLLKWLGSFLSDRYQKVTIRNYSSKLLPVSSGIVQGSVLGPTLFSIFIDNIDKSLEYCSILKYADDIRIYLSSLKNNESLSELRYKIQCDIDNVFAWSEASGMKFNIDKCFHTTFGHCSLESTRVYHIDHDIINSSSCFGDLGVTISTPLSFNNHMDRVVNKGFQKLGLIQKIFQDRSPKSILRLYTSFIRPTLEYSSLLWNPYSIGYISKMERVQRRMCRILPCVRHLGYKDQVKTLGLLSLRARRLRFQLITMYRIYKNFVDINFSNFFNISKSCRTRGHNAKVDTKHAKNNYRLNFFTVSAISLWNRLPQELIDAPTVNNFKIGLVSFFTREDIW